MTRIRKISDGYSPEGIDYYEREDGIRIPVARPMIVSSTVRILEDDGLWLYRIDPEDVARVTRMIKEVSNG